MLTVTRQLIGFGVTQKQQSDDLWQLQKSRYVPKCHSYQFAVSQKLLQLVITSVFFSVYDFVAVMIKNFGVYFYAPQCSWLSVCIKNKKYLLCLAYCNAFKLRNKITVFALHWGQLILEWVTVCG